MTQLGQARATSNMGFWIKIILVRYIHPNTNISTKERSLKPPKNAFPRHPGSQLLLSFHDRPLSYQFSKIDRQQPLISNQTWFQSERVEEEKTRHQGWRDRNTDTEYQKEKILINNDPLKRGRWEHRRQRCQYQRRPCRAEEQRSWYRGWRGRSR